ncbi:MAG: 4Fe-4S dicluster domain-containing protein [Dehalococcoidia bacterium]|nr:4Fe-4S dicluster domain-containing protein [Dehalococcoidia bacterium]
MVPPAALFGVIPIWIPVYILAAISFGLQAYFLYTRVYSAIRLGKPHTRTGQFGKRLWQAVRIAFGQSKVLQSVSLKHGDVAGVFHSIIFYGFLSEVAGYVLLIAGDTVWPQFSETILTYNGAVALTWYLDIVGALLLLASIWGMVRRWVIKPHRLSFDLTRSVDAYLIPTLIIMLMVFSFLTEGMYIASGGAGPHAQAPIGRLLGGLYANAGVTGQAADLYHGISWWAHLLTILGFGVYIPLSKHMHLFAAPLNAFLRRTGPMGALEPIKDLETAEHFGAGRVQDLTQKELLDGFACAVCGRCTDACPAHISGKILSPMHIVENVKGYLLENAATIKAGKDPEHALIGGAIAEEALWDCLTCGACIQACPVAVEHVDTIVDMRRFLVMEQSKMPETAMNTLRSIEQRGHPWRGTVFGRLDWAKGLDVLTMAEAASLPADQRPDVLVWVGCTGALEQRSQAIPRSLVSIFKKAGVKFAILGEEESCTGDPARRMGNEYLFQTLAQQAILTLKRYNVTKIVTICPHCFNTMKNEYPDFGGKFEVLHYSQYVDDLIKSGRIKPIKTIDTTVAYHDSCYLGRHNGIYDQPRDIARAIPGLKLVEMGDRCRENGFCCGAGGGHMWIEESRGQRVNHVRTDQFLETDANTVASSCPFCLQMMTEGLSAKGKSDTKQAKDLLEILAESVQGDPANKPA